MDATQRELILQRWNVCKHELLPELKHEVGALTPKLEKVIQVAGRFAVRGRFRGSGSGLAFCLKT